MTQRVYQAVCDLWVERHLPPTLAEIAGRVFLSKTACLVHVSYLEGEGLVERTPGIPRSIRPVGLVIGLALPGG